MTKAVWGVGIRQTGVLALILASTSCGDLVRQGTASSYLVVNELVAASGADPSNFGTTLFSDVITVKDDVASTFADNGRVSLALGLKDPGTSGSPNSPSANNAITLDRYHVKYIRADRQPDGGKQGVDVPYEFDGGLGFTITDERTETFELVRHVAKEEAPLAALAKSPVIILTIAEITFYGHDQTGRGVSTTARVSVEFGNFADPK
jgi:hypothetical protein